MSKRWHMKLDQSGAGECFATVKDCPNGEFGHYDSAYEVSLAYEHKVRTGEIPGLTMIRTLRREEITEQSSELRAELAGIDNNEDYLLSIATHLHPLDGQMQHELLEKHSGDSALDRSVRAKIAEMSESSNVLNHLVEHEDNYEVLQGLMSNRQASDENLRAIYAKHQNSIPGLAEQVMLSVELRQRARDENSRADSSFLRKEQELKRQEQFKKNIEAKRAIPNGPLAHHALAIGDAEPITFSFLRNTKSLGAETSDTSFGQEIEPAGRYMTEDSDDSQLLEGWERGKVRFTKPLRVDFGGDYGNDDNWKNELSAHYGGRTGAELSQAIRNDGYDAILTEDHNGSREVVDLTMYHPAK